MLRPLPALIATLLFAASLVSNLNAQPPKPPLAEGAWEMQQSTTTASLRGIYAVGGGVAWASGANGIVLRTEDSGFVWQSCAIPPGAETLDFRGVWAWDAQTAIVMSSGPGSQSRLYRTIDGCASWSLMLANTEKEGFWDAIQFASPNLAYLLGDPVGGQFTLLRITAADGRYTAQPLETASADATQAAAFAASNSALAIAPLPGGSLLKLWFGAGGKAGARVFAGEVPAPGCTCCYHRPTPVPAPLASGNASSGVFSLAFRDARTGVAVGGDYRRPNDPSGTAAYSTDGGLHWGAASRPPHGYRSAVAWDAVAHAWIAVGPNGSDISYDDGRTWSALGSVRGGDVGRGMGIASASQADRDETPSDSAWNALSLPWAVGPKGRIGKLRALPQTRYTGGRQPPQERPGGAQEPGAVAR